METNVLTERLAFVLDWASGQWSMAELCERHGVTRPTGYKWVTRHVAERPRGSPTAVGAARVPAPDE